jgi:putative Mn2+ efflux pump MntP
MTDLELKEKKKSAQINNVLGIFVLYFGGVILIATYFTDTFIGEMTNLVAGLILVTIGGGMMYKAKQALRILKKEEK